MHLLDTVTLITGGARIGAAVATAFAVRGSAVAVSYHRSRLAAEAAVAQVLATGGRAAAIHADVTRAADCEALVKQTVETFGHLDILVNMASLYDHVPFDRLTPDDWDRQVAVDLRASFLCARAAVPMMRRQRGGRIINFADWTAASGRPRYPGYLPYYVAKAGVIALTQALALELAADHILVNAIAPGPIVPPAGATDEEVQEVERATPVGRWGGEAEIVKAALLLVDTDFITGETVRVDGGRHLR